MEMLQHFLGHRLPHAPALLDDAVIVGLDAEWFERGNKDITELGIAIIDTRDLSGASFNSAWEVLEKMNVYHARIAENAHMVNTKYCPGRPDMFQFGQTRFVTKYEARQVLIDAFCHDDREGTRNRPVVFVGHAVDNDVEMMNKHFGIDLNSLGSIIATIDTQVLALEAGIAPKGTLLGLRGLLAVLGFHEQCLHTAGNDIAYTMITALQMAYSDLNHSRFDLFFDRVVTNDQPKVEYLKYLSSLKPGPKFGIPIFCTRCDSKEHMAEQCDVSVFCEKFAEHPKHYRYAHTHKMEKCGIIERTPSPPVVIPCELCSMSIDPKRWKKAGTHVTEDCFFAKMMSKSVL